MQKNYPINIKIPGAHLLMMSNHWLSVYKFSEKIYSPISTNMRGQNHVHRRRTDRQTDVQGETNIPPPQTLFARGIDTFPFLCQHFSYVSPSLLHSSFILSLGFWLIFQGSRITITLAVVDLIPWQQSYEAQQTHV